ncbi:MAG: DUF3307 domain-containing protein [Rhodobacteraceae bacterium]|nr:DUF3307 domain-containing protein [Paracoccaceae bacterium]
MTETLAALLLAHALADFAVQTGWMAAGKAARQPSAMALHGVAVAATAVLCLGAATPAALAAVAALTVAHLVIDLAKTFARPGLAAFLADQGAHLALLAAVAALAPDLWAQGGWAGQDWLAPAMALGAGAIIAVRAGQFAIAHLMDSLVRPEMEPGLPAAGTVIGLLERGLVVTLIYAGEPGAIGFLIAAKSILRFGTVGSDRAVSEYVIIGTLASFGWALIAAFAALALARSCAGAAALGLAALGIAS